MMTCTVVTMRETALQYYYYFILTSDEGENELTNRSSFVDEWFDQKLYSGQ